MPFFDSVFVLDFGSQYTHLLARRVRELGVFSKVLPPDVEANKLRQAKGLILSGGPASVYEKNAPVFNPAIFSFEIPVLGLCYGQQLMAHVLGGKVKLGKVKEYGKTKLKILHKNILFDGLADNQTVWMSHGDKVVKLPKGFQKIGSTSDCVNAAIWFPERKMFGLQFHPEVMHTVNGRKILANFLFNACNCKKNWKPENIVGQKILEIKKQAGKKKVFLLASGGVDSTVALGLLYRALGKKQVFALHVDHGFMRKKESEKIKTALTKIGIEENELKIVNASKDFFTALDKVTDPEEKRKIIGRLFVEIAEKHIKGFSLNENDWLLGQGTIYPDTIETKGTKNASHIKTHHNQAQIIKELSSQGKIIEPLKDLYKDEVRELGLKIGLPKQIVFRKPFPGPGLAIRALCSNGKQKIPKKLEKKTNSIAQKHGFKALVLPVKSVGVQGDFRTYSFACALTGKLDWKKLETVSTSLTNQIKEINRIVFCLWPEKIVSIELVEAFLSIQRIELLQEADNIALQEIQKHAKIDKKIWQFPVILLPLIVNKKINAVVLRPVSSTEAMTASFYQIPKQALEKILKKLKRLKEIGAVFFDITNKPPATIEWE